MWASIATLVLGIYQFHFHLVVKSVDRLIPCFKIHHLFSQDVQAAKQLVLFFAFVFSIAKLVRLFDFLISLRCIVVHPWDTSGIYKLSMKPKDIWIVLGKLHDLVIGFLPLLSRCRLEEFGPRLISDLRESFLLANKASVLR